MSSRLLRLARAVDAFPLSPTAVGQRLVDRHHDRRRARAATDPEWAAIESRRDTGEHGTAILLSDDLTWDDFDRQQAIADRITPAPWWLPAAYTLTDAKAARAARAAVTAVQRARRGWADADTWNLGDRLCLELGAQLIHLADQATGWPSNDEFPTFEDWTGTLRRHGQALLSHDEENPDPAQNALRWVADHLAYLWD